MKIKYRLRLKTDFFFTWNQINFRSRSFNMSTFVNELYSIKSVFTIVEEKENKVDNRVR